MEVECTKIDQMALLKNLQSFACEGCHNCCSDNLPAKVVKEFSLAKSFGLRPDGNADLLIKHALEPESGNTRSSFLLRRAPIVFAVQMVAGHSFIGKTFGHLQVFSIYLIDSNASGDASSGEEAELVYGTVLIVSTKLTGNVSSSNQ